MTTTTREQLERDAQTKVARAELVKRVLIVVTAILVSILIGLTLYVSAQIRDTQQDGSPAVKAARAAAEAASATNERVLDCVEPTGQCFKDGQERTAGAVATLQRITLLAAVCSVDIDPAASVEARYQDILDCVTKRLQRQS